MSSQLSDFQILGKLGEGSFAQVYQGIIFKFSFFPNPPRTKGNIP